VTLDESEGLLCSCFENTCIFGVHHELLNEDTHIITGKHAGILTVVTISFIRIFMGVASRLKWGIKSRQRQFPVQSLVSSFFRIFTGTEARPTILSLSQWMMANFKPKTPATARLSCCWMLALWQAHEQRFTRLKSLPYLGYSNLAALFAGSSRIASYSC